ncbi:hypothetical protein NST62_06040 [Ureibacillus sp. FSL K6-8385]|uniref:Uncharacterized protein n=1 Tax=Ureibacillus terrenus TaxID=118246 RepID=A0A540V5Y0_9BACL|nr:hypothetical protein [Ureibacillus terrenus]MED3660850.1 hypothetical protein [Ureibacillus terrenus]MED3764652.1 hypothetical protein [Ureibacillus terrenus]TQE92167.1 hypothetical protein FKZ59_00225 [Ureibacillus terrenus]
MANEMEKKRLGWFKNPLSNQHEVEQSQDEPSEPVVEELPKESEKEEQPEKENVQQIDSNESIIFSRDQQDKIAMDVIVSIENMIKDRQLLSYKYNALVEQLENANQTINRLKRDSLKKDQIIQEKTKEIRDLEISLTNKQMSYDQLLEDYKEYQLTHNLEYDKLVNQLETEKAKYNKLYEESSKIQTQQMQKISELEERIRNLEIENQKYKEQYEKIVEEKAQLMKTISDFTERMSFSFLQKPNEE